ncbi:MAG: sensor histidine kinase [Actinomycetota bacterium]
MKVLKKYLPLALSIGLVLAVAVVGLAQSARANSKAEQTRVDDRLSLQQTLAGLANQYVQFALKDAYDFASTTTLSLRPGDTGDAALIKAYVKRSALLNYGGAIIAVDGTPLNAYVDGPGLPPPTDPGYGVLRSALLLGKPGVSSVMKTNGVPVIALGIPVTVKGSVRAVYVGYFRADRNPLQTYNERLHYGTSGTSFLLDGEGTVVASSAGARVGTRFDAAAVMKPLAAGRRGFVRYTAAGTRMVASYSPIDIGGWSAVTTQTAAEFFGPIQSSGLHVSLALAALLVVAAALLFIMNHKRQMALATAYEYKGRLLANTTHELKTPLTAIRGTAVTLGSRWRTMQPDQVDQFLGTIHRRCDGLSELIDRILLGARLEAGREAPLTPGPIELMASLHAITAEFNGVSPKHQVRLSVPSDVWVNADREAVDQILGLLIENAIKYSPDGGEVLVTATDGPKMVSISVSDHGIGMNAEEQEHVFDPYFRAAHGDSSRFSGVGLGLAITHHLVRRSGGEITVASVPNVGTSFSFTLPKAEPLLREASADLARTNG